MNEDQKQRKEALATLLHTAGEQHLATHLETNGDDPEWALWYADYLLDNGIAALLDAHLLKSEMIYLLVLVDKQQKLDAPGAHWERFYTAFFFNRYLK